MQFILKNAESLGTKIMVHFIPDQFFASSQHLWHIKGAVNHLAIFVYT